MGKHLCLLIVPFAAALTLAAPAHADPNGDYLNIMANSPGVIGGPVNDALYVNQGYRACDILRGGATPEDAIAQLTTPIFVQPWLARAMVGAAQTALCPETK